MISIIIPIYNVERFLDACVASVVAQTYSDLEIILVDDGSTDCSGELADKWAAADDRIRVIHRENGGLSAARNTGMDAATGDYIFFTDSDDMLEPQAMEYLLRAIEETGSEAAFCGVNEYYPEDVMTPAGTIGTQSTPRVYTGREVIKGSYDLPFGVTGILAWNKLYKAEATKGIRFPEGRIREDEFTSHRFLHPLGKVAFVPEKLCCYRQRQGSIMNQAGDARQVDLLDAYLAQVEFFKEKKDLELYAMRTLQVAESLLSNIEQAQKQGNAGLAKKWRADLEGLYDMDYRKVKKPAKSRLRMWAFVKRPAIYNVIWNRK